MMRWPGVIKAGNDLQRGVLATRPGSRPSAPPAGEPDVGGQMPERPSGRNGKTFKVHLDGYNLTSLLRAGVRREGPRDAVHYFDQVISTPCVTGLEGELHDQLARQHRDGHTRDPVVGHDHQPSHGPLRARHGRGRRVAEVLRSADVAAGVRYRTRSRSSSVTSRTSRISPAARSTRRTLATGCYGSGRR